MMKVDWRTFCKAMLSLGCTVHRRPGTERRFYLPSDPMPVIVHVPHNSKKELLYLFDLKRAIRRLGMKKEEFFDVCRRVG